MTKAKDHNKYQADSKLEARIAFILMKAGVTGPEIDACLDWAFGPGSLYVPIYPDWVDRWRKLHPQFSVKANGSFVEWMFSIGFLYVQWNLIQAKKRGQIGRG